PPTTAPFPSTTLFRYDCGRPRAATVHPRKSELVMRLEDVTPIILTYNEEPNIGCVLSRLSWAKDVVLVDSHSADRTQEIARSFKDRKSTRLNSSHLVI